MLPHRHTRFMTVFIMVLVISLLTGCGLREARFHGTWYDSLGTEYRFNSDGTTVMKGLLTVSGTYRVADSSHVELELDGLLGIVGKQTFEYRFHQGELILTTVSGTELTLTKRP